MASDSRRTVLAWMLGTPFFLLPVPLTVDAPDIFGGYWIHARNALFLGLIGLAIGAAHVRSRPIKEWMSSVAGRRLRALGGMTGLVALAVVIAGACAVAGRQLARLVGALPMGHEAAHPPDLPHPAVVIGLLFLLWRIARSSGESIAAVRLLALVSAFAQGAAWLHANQFTTAQVPVAIILLFALGLAGGLSRLSRPGGGRDRVAWTVIVAALFVPTASLLTKWIAPLALYPTAPPLRWIPVVAGLFTALLLSLWVRTGISKLPPDVGGVEQLRVALASLASRLPLLAALGVLGLVGASLSMLDAGLLIELFGWLSADSVARWEPPDLPRPVALAWVILILRLGAGLRTRRDFQELLAGLSIGFAALVLGRVGSLLPSTTHSFIPWGISICVLLCTAFGLPRLRSVAWGRAALGAALVCAPLLAGPVIGRYVVSVWVGGEVSLLGPVALGILFAVFVPVAVLRPDAADVLDLTQLVRRLPLVAIALILPIYITVHAGLRPGAFILAIVVLAVLFVASRLPQFEAVPDLPLSVAVWSLFYVGFAHTAVFKLGPNATECAAIVQETESRVLLSRHAEGGEYLDVYPYDAVPLPGRDTVLASFKRVDRQGGFVEVISTRDPSQRARTRVQRDGGGPLWPERIVVDPLKAHAFVQVIGVGAHGLWELVPQGARDAVLPVLIGQRLALDYEPGNPAIDGERRTLAMTYVPNREGGNPLIEVFDLDSLESEGASRATGRMMQMADFVETDRGSGRHYAPTLYDFLRFAVIEVNPGLELGRHRETFHPVIGLAADPLDARLYLTNPLAGVMEVLDLNTWEIIQTVQVGRFPRDVAYDAQRKLLYVANYGDGVVVTFSTEGGQLEEIGRTQVGWLLRGIGVDESSGRVVAASACGVFEIRPAATKAKNQTKSESPETNRPPRSSGGR